MYTKLLLEDMKEKKRFGDIGVYERIILERISSEQDVGVRTGLISLKIRSTGEVAYLPVS
jgi:hypothetical protein